MFTMRKFSLAICFVLLAGSVLAQADTTMQPLKPGTQPRSNDHFLMQVGYTTWLGQPDSVTTGGLPRTFNAYFMLDFPFKTNPRWSVAIGAGVGTDNVFFDKTNVEIAGTTTNLRFRNVSDTNNFKKYKLATTHLEAPVELRFRFNPDNDRRSVKLAVGAKVGTLVNAHTKAKELQNRQGATLNDYKVKEFGKRYFNSTRIALTGRIGFGHFSLFGTYSATTLFKEGVGPAVRPLTFGLTISGL